MKEFNYHYYQIAVAIFQYSERLARQEMSLDTQNIVYLLKEQEQALSTCKTENLSWLPVFKSYKGNNRKHQGMAYVTVEMSDGTDYGFLFPQIIANAIYKHLKITWKNYHGITKEAQNEHP